MNILYEKGDLLDYMNDGWCDAIAHCCNCQGVMGSGIALQIKKHIPEAYEAYRLHEEINSGIELGSISIGQTDSMTVVFNLHAQNLYGYDGSRFVDYEALYETLRKTMVFMVEHGYDKLGVPYKMACDRAGGDWRIVESMLTVIFENSGIDILVVEYDTAG
jgi:O-acetyl-ADP-ribose deacetylase (regulator of RNase III)